MKDDAEGWITIQGNAGTKYAEASSKHYTILQETPLQKKSTTSQNGTADLIRQLEKGEAIEALEKPKEETYAPDNRLKGRAVADGAVGWMTLTNDNMKKWQSTYRCRQATPMHKGAVVEEEMIVREISSGEVIEFVEGPRTEGKDIRIRGRAAKDGAHGWITIKSGDGKEFFSC